MSDRDPARLFLALWPDAPLRAQLAAYRDTWRWPFGARPVADPTLHLTLHFIGAFARARIPALAASLAAVPVASMVLRPQEAEVWKGGIAVLRIDGEPALRSLHARLGSVLADADVALDPRAFAPHVTLARKAGKAVPPDALAAFEWRADGFAVVESIPGRPARYDVLSRFLAGQTWSDIASG